MPKNHHAVKLVLLFAAAASLASPIAMAAQDWTVQHLESLEYPKLSILSRGQGSVQVRCRLSASGTVLNAEVLDRSKPGRPGFSLLEEAALENVRKWRFRYTGRGPTPEGNVTVIYTFRLSGVCDQGNCPTEFAFDFPDHVVVTAKYRRLSHK